MIFSGLKGQNYEINTTRLKSGGEGEIYIVIRPSGMIAKIYHSASITNEIEKKLKYMVSNPPQQSILSQVAWPIDVLYDNNLFCGFVMSNLGSYSELWELYSYPPTEHKNITLKHKLIIAHNICSVIADVHDAGYVFGDFNPRNIGVDPINGTVAFWDVDTYHFSDKNTGITYRCKAGAPGYIAPELIQKCKPYKNDAYAVAPLDTFTKYTDNFALAIHIFKLLMNGVSPYNGINDNVTVSQGSPGVNNQAIERDSYCFKPGKKPQSYLVPPQTVLPQKMRSLFTRVFIDGRNYPEKRPTASEWKTALEEYENMLVPCNKNKTHLYMSGLKNCPWCEADKKFSSPPMPRPKRSTQRTYSSVPRVAPPTVSPPPAPRSNVSSNIQTTTAPLPPSYKTRNEFFSHNVTFFFITSIIAGLFVFIAYTYIAPLIFTPSSETGIIGWWLNLVSLITPYLIVGAGMICPWVYQKNSYHNSDWGVGNYFLSALISIAGIVGISIAMVLLAIIVPLAILIGIVIGIFSG